MRARAFVMAGSCRAAETGFPDGLDSGFSPPPRLEPIPDIQKPLLRNKPRFVLSPQKLYARSLRPS